VRVRTTFTGRRSPAGVSLAPFDAANLAQHVGDDPVAVAANRAELARSLGPEVSGLVWMDQVHGCDVHVITSAVGVNHVTPRADALVTTQVGLALCVLVADCLPVLLHDATVGVVAAVHAGRRGVQLDVVSAAVAAMRSLGAGEVRAALGPGICGSCYEVSLDVAEPVTRQVPQSASRTPQGRAALNLRTAVVAQLHSSGVDAVEHDARCTRTDPDLFSYRRDVTTGRQAGVVVLT
jgi:YfiH family protein